MKTSADLFKLFFFRKHSIRKLERLYGAKIEDNVTIKGPISNLKLGKNVQIQSNTVLHLGGMAWCEKKGLISIGDNGVISPNCVIYGCGPEGVQIGKNFDCAPGVCIFSSMTNYKQRSNHHLFSPVVIGDNVIIFANSVISPGVTIGNNAVIAAGSVVTKNIPAGSFAGGCPAKIIKTQISS